MKNILTMSVAKYIGFINYFKKYGIEKEYVLKLAEIDPLIFEAPDNRFTPDQMNCIIQVISKLTNKTTIGLYPEQIFPKSFSNILGHLLVNCNTLGEAINKYCRYERIIDETVVSSLVMEGELAVFNIAFIDNTLAANSIFIDLNMTGAFTYMNLLTNKVLELKEVHFKYQLGVDISLTLYHNIFKCPVIFNSSRNALVFDLHKLNLPIIDPNKELLMLFEKMVQLALDRLDCSSSYTKKVTTLILKEVGNNNILSISEVAEKMSMSVRSLQKYLKREGTSYTKLFNKIRMDIAVDYLRNYSITVDEIAYILGFSDISSFYKSFKKWTNLTPGEIRSLNCSEGNDLSM
ncbi:MAG: AraC family transcriptional regulator [Clostridia bacterium]|nr:AraC family transcriptional regulator [Clostridia bacterium]